MEIMQEFTENQFYLHAITLQLQEFVGVKLEPPNRDVLASLRNREVRGHIRNGVIRLGFSV